MLKTNNYIGLQGQNYQKQVHEGISTQGYELISKKRAFKLQPYIKKTDKILEYGCGNGWNLKNLVANKIWAFDVDNYLPANLPKNNINFTNNAAEIPCNYFDIIILHHVLEHVNEPFMLLQSLKQYLVKDGLILIFVPYDFEKKFLKYNNKDINHHLYCWNVQTLAALTNQAGFTILEAKKNNFGYERRVAKLIDAYAFLKPFYSLILKSIRIIKPVLEISVLAKNG
jgi:SAM-dependent methyltransferase